MKQYEFINFFLKFKKIFYLISFLLGAFIGLILINGCDKDYPHTRMNESGELVPFPGYTWDTREGAKKNSVVWLVGQKHPIISHIYSGELEGSWEPEAGYGWIGFDKDSCQKVLKEVREVRWCPGVEHPEYPHARASTDVGNWVPDEGYQFVEQGSCEVERVILVEKIVEKIVEKEVPKTIVKYVEKKDHR